MEDFFIIIIIIIKVGLWDWKWCLFLLGNVFFDKLYFVISKGKAWKVAKNNQPYFVHRTFSLNWTFPDQFCSAVNLLRKTSVCQKRERKWAAFFFFFFF